MTIEDRVKDVVITTLKIRPEQYSPDLAAGDLPQWDSLGHVRVLQATEEAFDLSFDVGDAIAIEDVSDLVETVRRYQSAP